MQVIDKDQRCALILGSATSPEVQLISSALAYNDVNCVLINSQNILSDFSLDFTPNNQNMCINTNGYRIPTNQIKGVYWSSVKAPKIQTKQLEHPLKHVINDVNSDCISLLQLLFYQQNLNWVNSYKAVQFHRLKPQQLALAKQLGALIPATYIGDDAEKIKLFCRAHPKSIVKSVFSGGYTQVASYANCALEEIKQQVNVPITLQALIPGHNLRSYVFGNKVFTGKIVQSEHNSHLIDYRADEDHSIELINTSSNIKSLAIRICRAFHLQYTAIDWRLNKDGEYVFLEANPAPMFASAQHQLGLEIDRAIVDLVLA